MARIRAKLARAVRLDADEAHVHFHRGGFWAGEQLQVCFDPGCQRPRAKVD